MTRVAFVCVGNAGRSQLATAFAERERTRRGLDDAVEIVTGGTDPKDRVHTEVVEALKEEDIDISDRTPRRITAEDVADADYIVTMGCAVGEFAPDDWDGTTEQWDLDDPGGEGRGAVRALRDDIEARVIDFFDRIEPSTD